MSLDRLITMNLTKIGRKMKRSSFKERMKQGTANLYVQARQVTHPPCTDPAVGAFGQPGDRHPNSGVTLDVLYSNMNFRQVTSEDMVIHRISVTTVGWPQVRINECMSHSTEAPLCYDHDMLMQCLAGIETRLQQFCTSLATIPASATCLTDCDFSPRFNKNKVGGTEF